jgi:putative acyl-CoA dehydrogenase
MPLNSIWEGSGNVMCLDVLRAIARQPQCLHALAAEVAPARGRDARLDAYAARLEDELRRPDGLEGQARRVAQSIAILMQGALLVRHAPEYVADAFCSSRLADSSFSGAAFGTLPANADFAAILERAWPE